MAPLMELIIIIVYGILACLIGYRAGRNDAINSNLSQEDITRLLVVRLAAHARLQSATAQSLNPAAHSCSHEGQSEGPSAGCCRGEAK